ncbi:MAG: glycosyltransferase family 2 protein [Gemmatimonadota bacterium]
MSFLPYLAVLPYLGPLGLLVILARRKPDLKTFPPRTGRRLSVIIPARNEEEVIERCVRSILASTYAPLEIVVVDDRSTDGTAVVVERLALHDARVKLVRGEPLPEGWFGKPWACVQGYRAASGELLCFTDADSIHEPALLAHAVGGVEATGAGLFTVLPAQICITAAERLVMPQIFYLLMARHHPGRVNATTSPRGALANGQFILMPRAAYERVGTHALVRHDVVEDLALAQETVRAGEKLVMVYALDLMRVRMYTGWAHLREGWSKNLYLGTKRSLPDNRVLHAVIPLILSFPFLVWLLPPVMLILALLGVTTAFTGAAVAASAVSALFWVLWCSGMGIPWTWGLGYPVGAAAGVYLVLRSTFRGARKVEWKGRVYGAGAETTGA